MDGSKVWDDYQAGEIVSIRHYCETDVGNTYLMFLRFRLLRGHFTAEQCGKEIALGRDTLAKYDGQHWREFLQMWPATE